MTTPRRHPDLHRQPAHRRHHLGVGRPVLRPTKITDEMAVFRGAHDSFFGRLRLDVAETFA
jgi:hypothetical protein